MFFIRVKGFLDIDMGSLDDMTAVFFFDMTAAFWDMVVGLWGYG